MRFLSRPKIALACFFVILFTYLLANLGYAKRQDIRVLYVIDGDTIIAKLGGKKVHIRLFGIDAPESKQVFGKQARRYLLHFLRNARTKVWVINEDKYNRLVGVLYQNGRDVNAQMVEAGAAWAYTFYTNKYAKAQASAKAHRRGLWANPKAQEPYIFRKRHKKR